MLIQKLDIEIDVIDGIDLGFEFGVAGQHTCADRQHHLFQSSPDCYCRYQFFQIFRQGEFFTVALDALQPFTG